MMPTKEHIEAIKAAEVRGFFSRSHTGSIVRHLIDQLQYRMINVTEGEIQSGSFVLSFAVDEYPFEKVLDELAHLASINAEGVVWGWKIDNMARVHFAPLDHLPQG